MAIAGPVRSTTAKTGHQPTAEKAVLIKRILDKQAAVDYD
jgi:hypothetical protein